MLEIEVENTSGGAQIVLKGAIDETSNFDEIALGSARILINTKDIDHINSVGVKIWTKFLRRLMESGAEVDLVACSPMIIDQTNLVPTFARGARITSLFVPFICATCGTETTCLFTTAELAQTELENLKVGCRKCGADAEFDDVPEEYFAFLNRK